MSIFQVEKTAVAAILYLADGSEVEGTLYLSAFSPHRAGAQTVADLMGEPGRVLPLHRPDGRFFLIGKASVAGVRVPSDPGPPGGFRTRVPGRLTLSGRHLVEGHLLIEEGAGLRLSDVLNAPDAWVPVEASDAVVWIAKDHLVSVEVAGV